MPTENLSLRMKALLVAMQPLEEKEAAAKAQIKIAAADVYAELFAQEDAEQLKGLQELYAKYETEARQRALAGEDILGVRVDNDNGVEINMPEAIKWALMTHPEWVTLSKEGIKAIENGILKREFEVPFEVAKFVQGKMTKIFKETILNG